MTTYNSEIVYGYGVFVENSPRCVCESRCLMFRIEVTHNYSGRFSTEESVDILRAHPVVQRAVGSKDAKVPVWKEELRSRGAGGCEVRRFQILMYNLATGMNRGALSPLDDNMSIEFK